MKYFIIGDEDTVLGFRMAGIRGVVVKNREQAEVELNSVLKNDSIGIILITERISEMLGKKVDTLLYRSAFPLILQIPDRNGPIEGRAEIKEVLRMAMGIKI